MNRLMISASWMAMMTAGCLGGSGTRAAEMPQGIRTTAPGDSVQFVLKELPSEKAGYRKFEAAYGSGAAVARFQIQFGNLRVSKEGDFPLEFGKGELIAVQGSKPAAFLAALCAALQASPCPAEPQERRERLKFDIAVLGRNMRRQQQEDQIIAGGFSDPGAGNWIATKLFLGSDDEEAEVFLNLNPKEGVGEFSIKDADYGVAVMKRLVTVL